MNDLSDHLTQLSINLIQLSNHLIEWNYYLNQWVFEHLPKKCYMYKFHDTSGSFVGLLYSQKYWENHLAICWDVIQFERALHCIPKKKRSLKYKSLSTKIVSMIYSFSKKKFYYKIWQNPTNQFFNKPISLARAHARVMNKN